jgi:hypothetical protein
VLRYLAEHRVGGRPSIAGYDGRLWAPFLPFDVDAHPPAATLDDARGRARRIHDLLTRRWQAPPAAVHAYFSGAKGFHMLVDVRAFGRVAPAADLHRVFTRLRLAVLRELPDEARTLFDLAIGDAVRLLRLPNTRHATSGLFKIPLAPDELLDRTAAEIVTLARAPRPLVRVAAAGREPHEDVAGRQAPARAAGAASRARAHLSHGRATRTRQNLLRGAPHHVARRPAGTRNNAAIRLASAFRRRIPT